MRRVHPIFRFLATALIVLVLGVATNIGVAWVLSYRAEGRIASWGREWRETYTLGWTDSENQRAVATAIEKRWTGVTYIRIFRRGIDDRNAFDRRPAGEVAPKWGAREVDLVARATPPLSDKRYPRGKHDSEMFVAVGWPCRAF